MSTEFEPGVGMAWTEDDTIRHGAVMAADNSVLEIVPVRPLRDGITALDRMKAAADLIDENQYGNDGQDGPDFP